MRQFSNMAWPEFFHEFTSKYNLMIQLIKCRTLQPWNWNGWKCPFQSFQQNICLWWILGHPVHLEFKNRAELAESECITLPSFAVNKPSRKTKRWGRNACCWGHSSASMTASWSKRSMREIKSLMLHDQLVLQIFRVEPVSSGDIIIQIIHCIPVQPQMAL